MAINDDVGFLAESIARLNLIAACPATQSVTRGGLSAELSG